MAEPSTQIPSNWPKDLRRLAEAAQDQGWRFDTTKSGHPRFWPPVESGERPATYSGTTGDVRSLRNFTRELVRKGLTWQQDRKKKGKR